ncbi:neck protein [Mycobacterium phage Patt]|uniref:Head-to-tail connector protein n=1 Tax=Mycobacterium phage Patt TaxID=2530139 RepID=A0A481VR17_9CAUD|nr:neck protein [Mycobacterium phage Patt]QBI96250.1 hypothetical protein SEA_PATT_17 [Mycobacterium phage Patt]
MGKLDIPISEHRKIRRSPEVQARLRSIASDVARRAGSSAGDPGGYGTDLTVESDRARAHVWPESGKAIRAEVKNAHLMGIAAAEGQ